MADTKLDTSSWGDPETIPAANQATKDPRADWGEPEELSLNAFDELTGEDIPLQFSGTSPNTAMNKTPLTALDRFKLSMGNEAGNIQYLKERFEDVQPILDKKGKPSKELAVLKEGKWHRVDPINGEIADPWEKAKEYAMDLTADAGPIGMALGAGAAIAAAPAALAAAGMTGAAATAGTIAGAAGSVGGAAAIAGATAAVRTSLGRVIGTYDATPAEQAWDIGFETLMNAAGQKFMLGVKPTASKVADKLAPLAAKFRDTVDDLTPDMIKSGASAVLNSPKNMFKHVMAAYSVGVDNFDMMVKHPFKVGALMKSVDSKVGGNVALYHDEIVKNQLNQVQNIASNSRSILSQIYGSMRNKILDSVDDKFVANLDDAVYSTYSDAVSKGFGKIVLDNGKELVGKDAAEHLALKGLHGAQFKLLSQKEMANAIKQGAELGDDLGVLAADTAAYKVVSEYYKSIGTFVGGASRTGKAGAKALLDFKKTASELSWSFSNSEKAQAVAGVKRIIDNSRTSIDKSIRQGLDRSGAGKAFDKMNATYSNLNKEFAPLLTAHQRYLKSGDQKVFESLLGSFLARPGKQASKRFAVDAAIDAAEEHGLKAISRNLANSKQMVQIGEAAKAFNPLKSSQMKADGLAASQAGMMAFAATSANMPLMLAVGGMQVLRQPGVAKSAAALTQGMAKGQQWLATQSPQMVDRFLSDPKAMQMFTNSIFSGPLQREQTEGMLMNMVQPPSQEPMQ